MLCMNGTKSGISTEAGARSFLRDPKVAASRGRQSASLDSRADASQWPARLHRADAFSLNSFRS
jgi:hypothetical protein